MKIAEQVINNELVRNQTPSYTVPVPGQLRHADTNSARDAGRAIRV